MNERIRMNMSVVFVLVAVLCVGFLGSGCSSIRAYPKRVVNENTELVNLTHWFTDDVYKTYSEKTDIAQQRYRDDVVNGRLRAVDLQFEIFQKAINAEKNLSQIGADWAVLGLSGAGTIVGGASTKAILAAISGGLTGAKLSFDKTLYYEKTMPALLAQMEASRAKQLLSIRVGLLQNTLHYPLTQALVDVDNYYKAGTLPGAIIAISNAAGKKTEDTQDQLFEVLKREFSFTEDAASKLIRAYWKPDTKNPDKDHEEKLKKWMKENGYGEEIQPFLNDEKDADGRKKAVEFFNLK